MIEPEQCHGIHELMNSEMEPTTVPFCHFFSTVVFSKKIVTSVTSEDKLMKGFNPEKWLLWLIEIYPDNFNCYLEFSRHYDISEAHQTLRSLCILDEEFQFNELVT